MCDAKLYDAMDIAKYFIKSLESEGEPTVSNLAVNKLLYFAQAHHLARFGIPLFDSELEAWEHGPVVNKIYHYFKICGSNPINLIDEECPIIDNEASSQLLQDIIENYGSLSAKSLENLSHKKGSPWDEFYTGEKFVVIPNEVIKNYFLDLEKLYNDIDESYDDDIWDTPDKLEKGIFANV